MVVGKKEKMIARELERESRIDKSVTHIERAILISMYKNFSFNSIYNTFSNSLFYFSY